MFRTLNKVLGTCLQFHVEIESQNFERKLLKLRKSVSYTMTKFK